MMQLMHHSEFDIFKMASRLVANPWESPRGVTLIFSYIRKLGPFFGVQNFEFRFFGVFRKINIFFGMKIF